MTTAPTASNGEGPSDPALLADRAPRSALSHRFGNPNVATGPSRSISAPESTSFSAKPTSSDEGFESPEPTRSMPATLFASMNATTNGVSGYVFRALNVMGVPLALPRISAVTSALPKISPSNPLRTTAAPSCFASILVPLTFLPLNAEATAAASSAPMSENWL
eukprot:CAMPEP_0180616414 /NCGR_PEP_ID=MMETSP1037_2-20121125/32463_1 /TAXON_ID=632150 /ORGANISM="Azadinium spinosum, Strain 3D9" /LENGTH=163 /DNA_ID=CAMNT_0022636243 /DNA_START=106 /DNA_END=597 /DNA_ORIENTATION=-